MSSTKKTINPQDLLLELNEKAKKFDISKYEDFIQELCGEWEFQKAAIRNVIKYYIPGIYQNSKQLLEENYNKNIKMQTFETKNYFLQNLPFPDKLACTIDLATATGKSWVMYGVARILLAEGIIDQALVLCPSTTIKYELYKKFKTFTQNSAYTNSLPKKSKYIIPGLKHSDKTIEKGDICIDNVHKTYDHVSSSISDSLIRKGQRTLVINDEAHHILNPKSAGNKEVMLEWYKFLIDEKYDFKYLLNLSGTPYKENNYFNDVIYRFSIREAIDKKYIKNINYKTKDNSKTQSEKWSAILKNHSDLKEIYPDAKKHITIVVTDKISRVNELESYIKKFLVKHKNISEEEVEKKVLSVTSSKQHDDNREILKIVDEPENPVEWIVSVSMLTEGWDVKNVFQIVPHEERAFNSKLLIAQVLGRGLRIPAEYWNSDIQPQVWIFNHTAWTDRIDRLVEEVAEINHIYSKVLPYSKYNFDLHFFNIDKKFENIKRVPKEKEIKLPKTMGFSTTQKYRTQEYEDIKTRRKKTQITDISKTIKNLTIEEATNYVYSHLYLIDLNKGTDITIRVTKDYIENLIREELKKIGEKNVSDENLQRAKMSFNVLVRPFTSVTKIEELYGDIKIINTSEMNISHLSEISFKNYGTLVSTKNNLQKMDEENLQNINKIKEDMSKTLQTNLIDENYIRPAFLDHLSEDEYKSPLEMTLLSYSPEREFVELMISSYIKYIDSWVKSKDKGFYFIPYIHRPGTHSLQKNFNPDFFIKKSNKIIVVEIKAKDDSTAKNKDKLEGAISYFDTLNKKLKGNYTYDFYFLEPTDYADFFQKVIVNDQKFKGNLHAKLESKSRDELKGEA